MISIKSLSVLLATLAVVSAHPGEDHAIEALERGAALNMMGKRSLSHCADKLAARGVHARNDARRRNIQRSLTAIAKRDIASALATDHHSNLTGVTTSSASSTFFTGQNQCILAPEVTEGPYYVTGEYFRQNVTEGQGGVPLFVDIQVIDTNTCEPLPNVAFDFWHCNATGVYSGVVANGNGDSSDTSNLNRTFLRGIQQTDSDGVVQFQSIVPGHYSGRTNHAHIMAHTEGNWELLANNTISGGSKSAHVGQLFFDQSLLSEVEAVAPYSTNTQSHTQNSEDNIRAQEGSDIDPIVEYVLLGDTVADGIFAWISVGLNSTATYSVQAAAAYGENGGVASSNAMGGGGGPGGAPGNGTGPPGMGGNGTATGGMGGNGTAAGGMGGNGTAPSGTAPIGSGSQSGSVTGGSGTAAEAEASAATTRATSGSCRRHRMLF